MIPKTRESKKKRYKCMDSRVWSQENGIKGGCFSSIRTASPHRGTKFRHSTNQQPKDKKSDRKLNKSPEKAADKSHNTDK